MSNQTAMPQVGARFAELICADRDWLNAEFDALVAANYGAPPGRPSPPAPPHVPPSGVPGRRGRRRPASVPAPFRERTPRTRAALRHQRAPPPHPGT
ncbi:MAG TPA: hypothetical protein VFU43_27965 [Streptosporangiaceae bacterium]|nr:hypothetical protein [Streptosporangiaceae bacterium]